MVEVRNVFLLFLSLFFLWIYFFIRFYCWIIFTSTIFTWIIVYMLDEFGDSFCWLLISPAQLTRTLIWVLVMESAGRYSGREGWYMHLFDFIVDGRIQLQSSWLFPTILFLAERLYALSIISNNFNIVRTGFKTISLILIYHPLEDNLFIYVSGSQTHFPE